MRRGLAALGAASLLLAGCSSPDDPPPADPSPAPGPATPDPAHPAPSGGPGDLAPALSEPAEDSYYPQVGDPGVDALHYDLTLDWDPASSTLRGEEVLTFRATETADDVRLDLGEPLEVTAITLDGAPVEATHDGDVLVVDAPVEADARHELAIAYSGTPEPVESPTTRDDVSTVGWTTTDSGETWTMQEPYGAFTWYAVNDHPSDKALYDLTLTVPAPWTGVANGELVSRTTSGGVTETRFHLAEPAAAYLLTVATGDLVLTEDVSASGVPIDYWTPRARPELVDALRVTPDAIAWLEERLGPYPFDTAGLVVVDSDSAMETQTMITLGDTDYATSPEVILHELAHHWYGDQVTPDDWRDVWMNEGMAMYLQGVWTAEDDGIALDGLMDEWADFEPELREEAGPPADFDPTAFGESNIYYGPALMWHELRERLGDDAFWSMVRAWPAERDNGNAGREDYLAWIEEHTGEELTAFFDDWLLGETSPPRD